MRTLTLDFDRGPLCVRFAVYKTDLGWILTSFNFSTKDDLFPESLFPATTQP